MGGSVSSTGSCCSGFNCAGWGCTGLLFGVSRGWGCSGGQPTIKSKKTNKIMKLIQRFSNLTASQIFTCENSLLRISGQ